MSLFLNKGNFITPPHPPLTKGGGSGEVLTKGGIRRQVCAGESISQSGEALAKKGAPRCNGFTLLEVLIAVTLLSVILAAIYSTFMLSHRATEGMDESLLKTQEARKALDILNRELDAAVYRGGDSPTLLKIRDRDIYGKQAAQLIFTAFSPLRPGLSRISYYVEEKDKKLYLYKKTASPSDTGEIEGIDIIEDIGSFTVEARYHDTWVRTWDTDINKGVPDEIRVSLSFMVKGREVTFFDVSQPKVDKPIS